MHAVTTWIETHPTIFALVVWPLLTAILTSLFAKPSDAFAAKYPRLAAIRRIPSDAGINLPKLLGNVLVAITGKRAPAAVPEAFPEEGPTKKEGRSLPPLPIILMLLVGCTVTPSQHAANLAESAQIAAEYTQCRESAKADGGWPAYESCACRVDAKHGLDASAGCP